MTQYSAIILAGGKSSRMGQKKAELYIGDRTFIDTIIEKLKELGIEEIIISGYKYKSSEYIYVKDVYPDKGPLAGIHAGLCKSTNEKALVVSEDAPLIPLDFIRQLMNKHMESDLPITIASCGGRMQPLLGIYDKSLVSVCENLLMEDNATPRALIEKTGSVQVPYMGDELIIRGCNTPEEYVSLAELIED
jgi:molybdopterin-guanine dinucleotide biosynthesis protein A